MSPSLSVRLQAKAVKRSQNRNVVAASAYRAGVALYNAAVHEVVDYSRRKGVEASGILLPPDAPVWMADREQLWNHVEAIEKRHDAQLARELQIALPEALPSDTRHQLIWDFCRDHIVPMGMVADIAIHAPGRGDQRNYHAHVLLTMRTVTPDGFGKKERAWNDNAVLEGWKAAWEAACNKALEDAGNNLRLDRRSLVTRRRDILDQAAAVTIDLQERNRLLVAAERLNYTPRPYLPPKIYEAMVEGRKEIDSKPLTSQQRAYMDLWQDAMQSRKDAAVRADELERRLAEELKAAERAAAAILLGDLLGDHAITEATLAILAAQDTHDPAIATTLTLMGVEATHDPRTVRAKFRQQIPRRQQVMTDLLPKLPLFKDLSDALTKAVSTFPTPLPYQPVMRSLSEHLRHILTHAVSTLTRLIFTERNPMSVHEPPKAETKPDAGTAVSGPETGPEPAKSALSPKPAPQRPSFGM